MKWYSDTNAEMLHKVIKERIEPQLYDLLPNHELSHLGISRSDFTEEVIIKLHFNPLGIVKVVPEKTKEPVEVPLSWFRKRIS